MVDILNKEKILEMAQKFVDEGRIERAISEYQKLVNIDSSDYRVKLKLAELFVRIKNIPEAIKTYEDVAKAYTGDGFYLKAVTVYKNVLRLNPGMVDINIQLAELYEKMGLSKDAIAQYHIVENLHDQWGQLEPLVDIRKRIVAIEPGNIHNRIKLAEAYQIQGKEEESLSEYESLAEQLETTDREDQLIEFYEKILSHRADRYDVTTKLARLYYKRGELKKSLKTLDLTPDMVQKDTEMIALQADMYGRLNQVETAKGKYLALADLYYSSGNSERALESYEKLLVIAPDMERELTEIVEAIKSGAMVEIVANALQRREKMAKQEEAADTKSPDQKESAEKEDLQRDSGELKNDGAKKVTVEAAIPRDPELIKKAISAYELGRAYLEMGLVAEGDKELRQAYVLFQQAQRELLLTPEAEHAMREIADYFPDLRVTTEPEPCSVEKKVGRTTEKKRGPQRPLDDSQKRKKRISFV